MRAIGAAELALGLLCARARSRVAFGKPLAELGGNPDIIANLRMAIEQARLLTLKTAWTLDTHGTKAALSLISQIKVVVPAVAQQAAEAANIESHQLHMSFEDHRIEPGRLVVRSDVPPWVRAELSGMGYKVETLPRTSGPITAILIDPKRGTFQGAASDHGEDYGIAW